MVFRGGSKGGRRARSSTIPLGEPISTVSAEHHLKEAYEQGMVLKCWKWPFLGTQIFKFIWGNIPSDSPRKLPSLPP